MALSYILFTLLGFVLIGFFIWNIWFNPNPYTWDSLLFQNAPATFKVLGALSTIGEVINLALNDMQSNGSDPFQAFSRYILYGLIEIVLTFYFISVVSTNMEKAAADGKITFKEYFLMVMKAAPLFIFGFLATSQLHNFYLWSIYHVEYQQQTPVLWFLPMTGSVVETNPMNFEIFTEENGYYPLPIVPATVTLIYLTPVFNIILVFAQWYKVTKDISDGKYETVEIEIESDPEVNNDEEGKKKTDLKNPIKTGLNSYTKELDIWFGIDDTDFFSWLSKYIGSDISTGKDIRDHRITNKDVLNGSASSQDILIDLTDKLIGGVSKNNYTGLSGIKQITDNIGSLMTRYKTLESSINDLETQRKTLRSNNKKAGDITVEINDFKKDFETLKDDIMEELQYRKGIMKEFSNILTGLNFKLPNYDDGFDAKIKKEL